MTPERQALIKYNLAVLSHWMDLRDAVMAIDLPLRERVRRKVHAAMKTPYQEEDKPTEE